MGSPREYLEERKTEKGENPCGKDRDAVKKNRKKQREIGGLGIEWFSFLVFFFVFVFFFGGGEEVGWMVRKVLGEGKS